LISNPKRAYRRRKFSKRRFIYLYCKSSKAATTTAALINGGDGIKHTSAGGVEMGAVIGLGV